MRMNQRDGHQSKERPSAQNSLEMDISKYRTRFPPKEHEEAVRMLLEGLDKQKPTEANDLKHEGARGLSVQEDYPAERRRQYEKTTATRHKSGPAMSLIVKNPPGRTTGDSASSVDSGSLAHNQLADEDEEHEFELAHCNRRPAQRHDDNEFDFNSEESSSQDQIQVSPQIARSRLAHSATGAHAKLHQPRVHSAAPRMQSKATSTASDSVSTASCRLADSILADQADDSDGGYEAIPSRTIAIQCDLKLSSVKRDGLPLDSAASDLASMQASSISSTRYGFYKLSPETYEQRRQLARSISSRNIADQANDDDDNSRERSAYSRERDERPGAESTTSRASTASALEVELEDREVELELARARAERGQRRGYFDSSSGRARDSLPRRPKTALSYLSSSRLQPSQDTVGSVRSASDAEDNQDDLHLGVGQGAARHSARVRDRSISHQVLPSGRTSARLSADSDSDCERAAEKYRVPHNEELLLTRHGRQVSASRGQDEQSAQSDAQHLLRRSKRRIRETGGECRPGGSRKRTSPVSAAESALSSWRLARTPTRSSDEEQRAKLSCLNSMMVSRADRSCNLIASGQIRSANTVANANEPSRTQATGVGCAHAAHRPEPRDTQQRYSSRLAPACQDAGRISTLSRRDRSCSHQELAGPEAACCAPPNLSGSSTLRTARSRHDQSTAQLGRSTSMKQVSGSSATRAAAARFLSPQATNRAARRPAHYATTDCESSCCEQSRCDAVGALPTPLECDDCASLAARGDDQFDQTRASPPRRLAPTVKRSESEVSESPRTRTWANPSSSRVLAKGARRLHGAEVQGIESEPATPARAARSHSLRDVSALHAGRQAQQRFEHIYRVSQDDADSRYQSEETSEETSSSTDGHSKPIELLNRATAHHQPLDSDSQVRLNEIGLPAEPDSLRISATRQAGLSAATSSSSHLGLTPSLAASASRYATTGRRQSATTRDPQMQAHLCRQASQSRGPAITGRAMSQQSLTRPTMPLSRRLRRGAPAGSSQSGASEMGGSSLSLASRMRYENAHTRSPVVMYIPQAPLKASSTDNIRGSTTSGTLLRRGTRQPVSSKTPAGSLARATSQERKRGVSRQASDSETSSSMLRTLVKPRNSRAQATGPRGNGAGSSRRLVNGFPRTPRDMSEDEENMDGVGQLATEIDSYKFNRRYSVPKDAKINWFSKLKQRVTSSRA